MAARTTDSVPTQDNSRRSSRNSAKPVLQPVQQQQFVRRNNHHTPARQTDKHHIPCGTSGTCRSCALSCPHTKVPSIHLPFPPPRSRIPNIELRRRRGNGRRRAHAVTPPSDCGDALTTNVGVPTAPKPPECAGCPMTRWPPLDETAGRGAIVTPAGRDRRKAITSACSNANQKSRRRRAPATRPRRSSRPSADKGPYQQQGDAGRKIENDGNPWGVSSVCNGRIESASQVRPARQTLRVRTQRRPRTPPAATVPQFYAEAEKVGISDKPVNRNRGRPA